MNYYNEFDPKAATWLRELIAMDLIPDGVVDERSITEIKPNELDGFTQCHFFAGISGWVLALRLAGWPEGKPVWTGSCPCQPFSVAGKGRGTDDERHLWPVFAELIRKCQPPTVFGEQVASKSGREWLAGVFADLEGMGYRRAGADLCAAGVSSPHIRQRLFWVADSDCERHPRKHPLLRQEESGRNSGDILEVAGCCETSGLADTPSGGLGIDGSASREPGHVDERGEVGGLGDSDRATQERLGCVGISMESQQETGRPGYATAWSDFDAIPCLDGKTRRIESGTQPLVDGLPKRVVHSRDSGVPINPQATGEARVMRLRGYGNAIVPQVAAEFIKAFMEA